MTGDIQLSTDFHDTLIQSFGSVSIAAAFIRIPYSTVGGWLRKGQWPATKKDHFYQLQTYVQQQTAERI